MKMETEREQVRGVAARWRAQYGGKDKRLTAAIKSDEVQEKLDALDAETATCADVTAAIGNDTWCGPPKCHECGTVTWKAVELGEEPDYESATATICLSCLQKAIALLQES